VTVPQEKATEAQNMGELLDSFEPVKPLKRGDIVDGVVMRANTDGLLVNVGQKAEGQVPVNEMRTVDREGEGPLQIGDEVIAMVMKGESGENPALLSIDRAVGERGWKLLQNAMESGEIVEGVILGFNRGGAIVETLGVQGFVPISQMVSVSREAFRRAVEPQERPEEEPDEPKDESSVEESPEAEASPENEAGPDDGEAPEAPQDADAEVEDKAEDETKPEGPEGVGVKLRLKVLEVNRGRNRAILSERQTVQEQREEQKARLIQELTEGEVRRGRVTGISSFGAFVDLGGADGLIHISELSWTPANTPEDIVKMGEELDVQVLRVDAENKKIALSLKRLHPEPWETIDEKFQVGDIVDATVTKLTDFGAFARVDGSVEGLIHISELTERMIQHPREVVGEGDTVRLKILRIEPERRRLGLSLRQAEEEEGY